VAFDEIDLAFLYRYEHFLRQRKMKDSSISMYLRTLRATIAKAVKLGYSKELAFNQYKIPTGRANKRALSEKEMEAIIKLENRNDDNFRYLLFSYYTIGMNFTDIARLTWDDIRGNEIHYTRQKIHQKIIIPIHPKIREILNHYRPITGNITAITGANDNYIFPILSKDVHKTEAQKENRIRKMLKLFNKELKNIGASAKVDTVLTSYVLRHTAITNLVRLGITADAIQALAGHKRLTTTENYIKEASQEVKTKAVNML
jgi:integrase